MKKIKLQNRDLKILAYIDSQNFAQVAELYGRFFTNKKGSAYHYKRLKQLEQAQLIEKIMGLNGHTAGYSLIKKGYQALEINSSYELPTKAKADRFIKSYNHDCLVHKIKNILLTSNLVSSFIPEKKLSAQLLRNTKIKSEYRKGDKIPDGFFYLNISGEEQSVALEVELSLKSKSRYEKIFTKHSLTKYWSTVFYIVKDEPLRQKLLSYLEETKEKVFLLKTHKKQNDIYFALLDEVLDKKLLADFIDKDVKFSLHNLEKKGAEESAV